MCSHAKITFPTEDETLNKKYNLGMFYLAQDRF